VFNSNRNGPYQLFGAASNGGGRDERLFHSDGSATQPSWSHDGRWLVYSVSVPGASPPDLWIVPAAGGAPRKFVESPFIEVNAAFSPDDRFVAYTSNASGRREVYVRPFPSGNGEFKVSQHGGIAPAWRGDGQELFFVAPDGTLFSAAISTRQGFQADAPRPLFRARLWGVGSYVVSKDGSRFLVAVQEPTREETAITVTTNWLPKMGRTAQ
jgi:serine/threonine-protein kinase